MKFYIMWANHHVTGLWDNQEPDDSVLKNLKWPSFVNAKEWREQLVPRWIEYFKKPNYYKIDGKPVFWIYCGDPFLIDSMCEYNSPHPPEFYAKGGELKFEYDRCMDFAMAKYDAIASGMSFRSFRPSRSDGTIMRGFR